MCYYKVYDLVDTEEFQDNFIKLIIMINDFQIIAFNFSLKLVGII